ncbi:amidohydrolase family protein [Ramlibacter sp.]|uniref:amidohydrolase family protein n=1 Tax=Ramlibacter sp. TaxID=1917967 RepID=UPI003D122239
MSIAARYHVVDADTHIIEPPDLWTSRLPAKWKLHGPHVAIDKRGIPRWQMGEHRMPPVASVAFAGWKDFPPNHPPTLEDADPGSWQAKQRLERMDEYGVYAQVLYPNLIGFQSEAFMTMEDKELGLACVRAYNDFLIDFAEPAPDRFIGIGWLPFWNMEESIKELKRCAKIGIKGIILSNDFPAVGLPPIYDEHWFPIFELCQEFGFSINFHIGFADKTTEEMRKFQKRVGSDKVQYVKESAMLMMGNANSIADVILGGLCEKFPRLNFVSVESGASWVPCFMESLDWQWKNAGAARMFPERMLPSEYFRRQVYGSFWFEHELLKRTIELYPDNFMFETDYPHPTSLSPGPASYADVPSVYIDRELAGLKEEHIRKVLHGNAARVYGLKFPALREQFAKAA